MEFYSYGLNDLAFSVNEWMELTLACNKFFLNVSKYYLVVRHSVEKLSKNINTA